jgi:hypothetical protein
MGKLLARFAFLGVVALGIGLVAVSFLIGPEVRTAAAEQGKCCFTNPRYTGICEVTPGEDESCSSILAYLNNPNSTGKAYCGGTAIRGGWQQASCDD